MQNKERKKSIIYDFLLFITIILVIFFTGEGLIRLLSSAKLIYNIEMVKYAKSLKMEDPLGEVSHVHRTNSSAKLMGVDINLNNLGCRGPDVSLQKPVGTKRVLVMGSSITLGWGVEYDQVFTSLIERKLNSTSKKLEVINAGIGNYNSYYESRLFLRLFNKVLPDAVVLHYFINDAEANPQRNDNFLLKHSFLAAYLYSRIGTLGFNSKRGFSLFDYYNSNYREDNPDFKRAIDAVLSMKKICEENHVYFLIAIIPDFHNLKPDTPYKAIYDKIEATFKKNKIDTINTFSAFQKEYGGREKEIWVQDDDPHPNKLGHKIMAEEIYPYIKGKI
ncbi:MAG: SGNH/GDSL hydrolase family protein [Oligoflexia bacterium]|nr:SGNH/GDSL hydrolase family protein [Oligoflexia bacterium]